MDWLDFRMRLYRIVPLDLFDARDSFIATSEGREAKLSYYRWCGGCGQDPYQWQSLVEHARALLKSEADNDLVDAWAKWYASSEPGGRSETASHRARITTKFREQDSSSDGFMYTPEAGVWFDFLAYLHDHDGWLKKYDQSHLPEITVQL